MNTKDQNLGRDVTAEIGELRQIINDADLDELSPKSWPEQLAKAIVSAGYRKQSNIAHTSDVVRLINIIEAIRGYVNSWQPDSNARACIRETLSDNSILDIQERLADMGAAWQIADKAIRESGEKS